MTFERIVLVRIVAGPYLNCYDEALGEWKMFSHVLLCKHGKGRNWPFDLSS